MKEAVVQKEGIGFGSVAAIIIIILIIVFVAGAVFHLKRKNLFCFQPKEDDPKSKENENEKESLKKDDVENGREQKSSQ